MNYISRYQEKRLDTMLKQFSVVCLTGPRQAGKSTLLKHIKKTEWEYITFDQRGIVETALRDPDLFIKNIKTPAIIDEAQKAPEIFHSIKASVDERPERKFILSGSANFQLMQNITETLAGRTAVLELPPFSIGEMLGIKEPRFISSVLGSRTFSDLQSLCHDIKVKRLENIYYYILWGGLPKIYEFETPDERALWFENYRTTYIERDLRNLAHVGDLEDFQKFYSAVAFQTGNMLNLSKFAEDIGITVPTCKRYLNILRTSYQAHTLPAFHANVRKRLVKTPKCYLADTGLACFFLHYGSEAMLKNSGYLGAIFETWVVNEVKKICANLVSPPELFFWKPHAGREIDMVLEYGEYLYPIEIKHSIRIQDSDTHEMQEFMKQIKNKKLPFGVIFYRGDTPLTVAPHIMAIPLEYLWH